MRKNIEDIIQQKIVRYCHMNNIKVIGSAGGLKLPIGQAAKAKRMGIVVKGYPDLFFPGLKMFIELKRKGGRPSKEQKEWKLLLTSQGVLYILARSLDDVINILKEDENITFGRFQK